MKLVSLRKYLDQDKAVERAPEPEACRPFCVGLLTLFRDQTGEQGNAGWDHLIAGWDGGGRQRSPATFLEDARRLWQQQTGIEAERARRHAADMQAVLDLFQHALLSLAGNSEQNVGRLEKIQGSLADAVRENDVRQLKWSIGEILSYVRQEIEAEKQRSAVEVARLSDGFFTARDTFLRGIPGLAGRKEALAEIERRAASSAAVNEVMVAASLERLSAVTQRFTAELSEDLVRAFAVRLARETERLYRWNNTTLVGVAASSDVAALRTRLEEHVGLTFEHWAFANGRKVMLAQPVRWMCTGLTELPVAQLAEQIDRLE